MHKVELPNVVESYHRALHEVIGPFLSTGNPIMIQGMVVYFYHCELFYSIDILDPKGQKREKPFIIFAGQRTGTYKLEKCEDPRQHTQPFGYERRQQIFRTVYAGIPRTLILTKPPYSDLASKQKASMMDAENVWSQLVMVLDHQHNNFNERGIFNPRLPMVPMQTPHLDYYMVQGEMQAEIRYRFTRNNTF